LSNILKPVVILFLGLCLSTGNLVAEQFSQDDLSWLKKMVFAAHRSNYSGTFIYQSGNYVETSRLTHLVEGGNEHERLESLDGERSEVIRRNGRVWCYQGDGKVMVARRDGARMFPALLPEQFLLLQENYKIRRGEEDRVAGYAAHSMIFMPRDKMRYSHRMWAHNESGLLLKAVVQDERDHVIEQYTFTQLSMGGDIDRKWIVQHVPEDKGVSDRVEAAGSTRALPNESGWVVYALPSGFRKITEVTRHMHGKKSPVTHLAYTDGMAGISVFIEKHEENPGAKKGLHSNGLIQVYTKILGDHLLTVIGEVPPRTVMQVADSVRNGGQKQ
jgi:sigma-E factor negative regulatory protein RseB